MPVILYDSRPALSQPLRFGSLAVRDLVRSRWIARVMFLNNLRSRHRHALLSYLWIMLPPLAMAAVFALLHHSKLAVFGETELPYFVFVLAGMTLWQSFLEALNMPLRELQGARRVLSRSLVPHEAVLLAGFYEVLANSTLRIFVLISTMLLAGVVPDPLALLMPLGVLTLAIMGMAIGLFLAPVGLLFSDVGRVLTIVTSIGFFLTPVVYPSRGEWWLALNPVAAVLATTRAWLSGPADPRAMIVIAVVAMTALVLAWLAYRLARPHLQGSMG